MKHALRIFFFSLLFGTFAACDDQVQVFNECIFTESLHQICEEDGDGTQLVCVADAHPWCDKGLRCLMWANQGPVCTEACTEDSDCPTESTCRLYKGEERVCVPNEFLR